MTKEITHLYTIFAIPFSVAWTNQWKETLKASSRIEYEWECPSLRSLQTREQKEACIDVQLGSLQDMKYCNWAILCDK